MGAEGIGASFRETIVLDAGALIGAERGNDAVVEITRTASARGCELVIPATALSQVWRGSRSARLSILLAGAEIDVLEEDRAKEVGARLGARSATDIADAHVVCCGLAYRAAILTSDPDDIARLVRADETLDIVPV